MARRSVKLVLAAIALAAVGGGAWWWYESQKACCAFPPEPVKPPPAIEIPDPKPMGLMTSLPLYWAAGADMQSIASGRAEVPWQRDVLEARAIITPIDTLSPIAGLMPEDEEVDPLADLSRLAIIQPRGLSPSDNVALDDWVRQGGRLLLVLDPMLTGEYPFALGDPRRPVDAALIPPVVARWGLRMQVDEEGAPVREIPLGEGSFTARLAGRLSPLDEDSTCSFYSEGVIAFCKVGEGRVTLVADAATFEGLAASPEKEIGISVLMHFAFEDEPGLW
jgi:hypothetical protein